MSTNQIIILNHNFSDGKHHWSGNECKLNVDTDKDDSCYANLTGRKKDWNSLDLDTTGRFHKGRRYEVSACVRIRGSATDFVNAKLKHKYKDDKGEKHTLFHGIKGFKKEIEEGKWHQLKGEFEMPPWPKGKTTFYIFGPQPQIDLHVKSVEINCLDFPPTETASTSDAAAGNPSPRLPGEHQNLNVSDVAAGNTNRGILGSDQADVSSHIPAKKNVQNPSTSDIATRNPSSGSADSNQGYFHDRFQIIFQPQITNNATNYGSNTGSGEKKDGGNSAVGDVVWTLLRRLCGLCPWSTCLTS